MRRPLLASSALTQMKGFQLPEQLLPAQQAQPMALRATGEGSGGSSVGLAFEIISCSLKGSQHGVWDALEVKESPPASQLLARSAIPWSPRCRPPGCCLPRAPSGGCLGPLACHSCLLRWTRSMGGMGVHRARRATLG